MNFFSTAILFLIVSLISSSKIQKYEENSIQFVKYPHLKIYDGYQSNGTWIAGDISTISKNLRLFDVKHVDEIQQSYIDGGIFFSSLKNTPHLHLFSSKEAITCLTGKKIIITGDSYMIQTYIGLSEIIFDQPVNKEIMNGKERHLIFQETEKLFISKFGEDNVPVNFLYYHCHLADFSCTHTAMKEDTSWKVHDAFIVNIGIHYKHIHANDTKIVQHYGLEVEKIFKRTDLKLTWLTGISYHVRNTTSAHFTFLGIDLAKKYKIPLIDIYTMTDACNWKNCTSDGGHKSRFVNRMKAQLLLNNLCQVS